jgi:pimeloyl-ACP methyl ester carboxylesterase
MIRSCDEAILATDGAASRDASMSQQGRSQMPTVSVNGTNLYYEELGQGKSLLFIHGMCGDATVWADQMTQLAPHFHTVAYDRRGHSRSPLGQVMQRTVELHADDAAQLIVELGLSPCVVVGSSGGARIAVDLVRRYPRLVSRAVFSEPPLMSLSPESNTAFMAQLQPAIEAAVARGGPRAAVDAFFEIECPGLWRQIPESRRDIPYRANAAELVGDLAMPAYVITRSDLAQIRRPCLVVRGSESMPGLQVISGILAESIPGARLVELEGSGHVTYFEKPAEFAAAVESFALTQV